MATFKVGDCIGDWKGDHGHIYLFKGHLDRDELTAAAAAYLHKDRVAVTNNPGRHLHQWYRFVPGIDDDGDRAMQFRDAKPGSRGAFRVTECIIGD
jgi:hypothetical protein